jgi:hypothetical protein
VDRLAARLSAADVHNISLREDWTATVIPSKFFGALAIGSLCSLWVARNRRLQLDQRSLRGLSTLRLGEMGRF